MAHVVLSPLHRHTRTLGETLVYGNYAEMYSSIVMPQRCITCAEVNSVNNLLLHMPGQVAESSSTRRHVGVIDNDQIAVFFLTQIKAEVENKVPFLCSFWWLDE